MVDSRADTDEGMGKIYALVVVCHAMVITLLWWFGRTFSH